MSSHVLFVLVSYFIVFTRTPGQHWAYSVSTALFTRASKSGSTPLPSPSLEANANTTPAAAASMMKVLKAMNA